MSKQLIAQYYNKVDKLIQFGASRKETSIRNEFYNLLNHYADKRNLVLVAELAVAGTKGKAVTPDGTLKNILRLDYGYWESKDESDDLNEEIDKKVKRGYPLTNILFEDSRNAVLYQAQQEVMRVDMRKADELDRILNAFVNFKSPLVDKFDKALEQFKADIPNILKTLRERIDEAGAKNKNFKAAANSFLELCKEEINPEITLDDVREMMIQHILTSDIFNKIFDDPDFHRHNNIANELEKLVSILFSYTDRKNLLGSIEHYYDAINAAAANIADHHEKQRFLKALYENFYKAYNPKAADRLGVVYTPNEIVDFMIDSTNYLLEKHFGKVLWDKNVEILDPATGTGTFLCNMIDKCPPQSLPYKYKNEMHANEVAILPYYIANLNIEYTFKQKMNYYEEFPNLCFVDTLDNTAALAYSGKQHALFGLSSENARRITEQNKRKISVIIGNPPYNANQKNENENNKNREYPYIDKRIKDTYIKNSTAQKTKVYDMYSRFYRWAMDRVEKNGIVAFITNRSFIDSRTFDGFRKSVEDDFMECYIVDTGSDVRTNPKIAGTTHNVFGIQTGVALMFLVKSDKQKDKCHILYTRIPDEWRKEEKWEWFHTNQLANITFQRVEPDKNYNWLDIADNDFEHLLPLLDKNGRNSIISRFSNGISSNRDEWVYDFDLENLKSRVNFFIEAYNNCVDGKEEGKTIKWSRDLKLKLGRRLKVQSREVQFIQINYRPYTKQYLALNPILVDVVGLNNTFFQSDNLAICFNANGQDFRFLGVDTYADLHFSGDTKCLPLYSYEQNGNRIENVTDWGLEQFTNHYKDQKIKKEDIFHYTYAVLHNPAYRKKYELNLKREFPRIPFYKDFWKWTKWGKELMDLHIHYEKAKPFPLKEHSYEVKAEAKRQKEMFTKAEEPEVIFAHKLKVKAKLKADKTSGTIEIDELTFLTGVPQEAWEYKLGNRSALEWVLDQYKEKKPSDPTIAEKFNTYRFADYKDHVIDLLKRVCTVSVETMKVVREMEKEKE